MSKKLKVPPQGEISLNDVIKYMENTGILNKKYDADLDGIIDLTKIPLIPPSQLGFSFAWEKVAEVTTTTSVSAISLTGLEGDTDKIYVLIGIIFNPSTTLGATWGIRFNSDTTISNYTYLEWRNSAGTTSSYVQGYGSTAGNAAIPIGATGATSPIGVLFFISYIYAEGVTFGTNTYCLVLSHSFGHDRTYENSCGGWVKQAEITEIDIVGLPIYVGAGSKFWLFKPKW